MSRISQRGRRSSGLNIRGWSALLACTLLPSLGAAQVTLSPCPAPIPAASWSLAADVRYLADDALEGRATGSPGMRCAAEHLVRRFSHLGLRPGAADGSWYQTFPVRVGSDFGAPGALQISGTVHEQGKGWIPYGFSGSGDVEGRLVYAGPGVSAPGTPDDAYAHVDLTGAVAVVEASAPGITGMRADPHFKATIAQGRGAAALVILLPEGAPAPRIEEEARPPVRIPVVAVSAGLAAGLRESAQGGASARVATQLRPRMVSGQNVLALLPGADPALADEVIIVGAHYDHLGWGGEGSLAPDDRAIPNGADDNASGTAALVEIARRLSEGPRPARSVLFMAFAGEEMGLLGSSHYVDNPVRALEETVAMINLDMVGRLEGRALTVFGMATASEWEGLVQAANAAQATPLQLTLLQDGFGPSDHAAFFGKGVPVLHFFTGTHADYHRPSDDFPLIDTDGLARVSALVADVTRRLTGTGDSRAASLTRAPAEPANPHAAPSGDQPVTGGYGPYFGSIPDMTPQDFGVRLTGVRDGSPAAIAGLREGDVLVSFGGKETGDLYAFTYALQEHAPGDRVEVVVVRNGERVTMEAVLGER